MSDYGSLGIGVAFLIALSVFLSAKITSMAIRQDEINNNVGHYVIDPQTGDKSWKYDNRIPLVIVKRCEETA